MIDFHRVTMNDMGWMNKALKSIPERSCEYTFGNIFGYDAIMQIFVAEYAGCLVTKCVLSDEKISYCFPIGNGNIKEAFEAVLLDAQDSGAECDIFGLTKENADFVNENYAGRLEAVPDRDGFDYVYLSTDLITLAGRKFQPKRNHISFLSVILTIHTKLLPKKIFPNVLP